MMLRGKSQSQRGSVTAFVLGVLSILGVIAISFRAGVTRNATNNVRADAEAQAYQNALSGIALVEATLEQYPDRFPTRQPNFLGGQGSEQRFDGIAFSFEAPSNLSRLPFAPLNTRLNVNVASPQQLQRLGLGEPLVQEIVRRRRSQEFLSWDELYALPSWPRGPEGEPDPASAQYLTLFGSGKVNVNYAPWMVIHAVTGLNEEALRPVAAFRNGPDGKSYTLDDRDFFSVQDFVDRLQADGPLMVDVKELTTEATDYLVWVKGAADLPGPPKHLRKRDGSSETVRRQQEVHLAAWLAIENDNVRVRQVVNVSPRPLF